MFGFKDFRAEIDKIAWLTKYECSQLEIAAAEYEEKLSEINERLSPKRTRQVTDVADASTLTQSTRRNTLPVRS